MGVYLIGLMWVLGAALIVGVAAYVVRRMRSTASMVENNDSAGQVFTIVGGLHAVLIAFVLISLFDAVTDAEESAFREADGLVAAYWAATALGEPVRAEVQGVSMDYANRVIDQEWPRMREGQADIGDDGWTDLERLRVAVTRAQATESWQNDQKTEAADKLWEVYQARQERLDAATSDKVNTVMWFALVLGSLLSVSLPLLFGGPRLVPHIIIVSILAGTLSLLLYATLQLQNPYGGGAAVEPAAFEAALARLR